MSAAVWELRHQILRAAECPLSGGKQTLPLRLKMADSGPAALERRTGNTCRLFSYVFGLLCAHVMVTKSPRFSASAERTRR